MNCVDVSSSIRNLTSSSFNFFISSSAALFKASSSLNSIPNNLKNSSFPFASGLFFAIIYWAVNSINITNIRSAK